MPHGVFADFGARGFAETDSREYWLTPKALRIGQAYVDSAQLPRMLRPIVEQVARQTQEHVSVVPAMVTRSSTWCAAGIACGVVVDQARFAGANVLHGRRADLAGLAG